LSLSLDLVPLAPVHPLAVPIVIRVVLISAGIVLLVSPCILLRFLLAAKFISPMLIRTILIVLLTSVDLSLTGLVITLLILLLRISACRV